MITPTKSTLLRFPLWWIGAKYVAGGSSFLVRLSTSPAWFGVTLTCSCSQGAFFNCCVHVIMYSYYALSTLGERVRLCHIISWYWQELLPLKIDSGIFFFCNWILHIWNGFYTWSQSKISFLRPLIRTPSIVKGNKSLYLVWSKWGSQWRGLQCVAISHWSNGFSANEEYWNISLTTDVFLSLIGWEKSNRVLS